MNDFRKGKYLLLLVLVLTIFQAGCSFKDIDKRVFVIAMSIDPSENNDGQYKITLKIPLSTGSLKESSGPQFIYLSHESETIGESIRILETHIDKELEFGHTKLILLNEQLLAEDLGKFMDYFTRRGDIQLIAYVAVAKSSAEKVLKTEVPTESPASIALFNLFDDNGTESPYIVTTHLFEFRRDIHGLGIDAILPVIEAQNGDTELVVNQSVVVKNMEKPIELSSIETKHFNSLSNGKKGFDYKVESETLTLLLNIDRMKMNYTIITDKEKPPRIDMQVRMEGFIGESSEKLFMKDLEKYNKIAREDFQEKFTNLLKKLQENKVDPFGFGLRYRATRLNEKNTYSDWEQMYPTIDFNVIVDVRLTSTGAIE